MTTQLKLESKPWGCILSLDNDVIVPIVEEHYSNLPKIINDFCKLYIQRKGRGKERELIRPMVKDILLDLSDLLSDYGDKVVNHLRDGKPLDYELAGLNVEQCKYIFRQCRSLHLDKEIIHCDYALFGAMLKEFYLSVNNNFLPHDFRDAVKRLGRSKALNDYYSLGELMMDIWENEPRKDASRVFLGMK